MRTAHRGRQSPTVNSRHRRVPSSPTSNNDRHYKNRMPGVSKVRLRFPSTRTSKNVGKRRYRVYRGLGREQGHHRRRGTPLQGGLSGNGRRSRKCHAMSRPSSEVLLRAISSRQRVLRHHDSAKGRRTRRNGNGRLVRRLHVLAVLPRARRVVSYGGRHRGGGVHRRANRLRTQFRIFSRFLVLTLHVMFHLFEVGRTQRDPR